MFEFQKISDPEEVPVYHQKMPEIVKGTHLQWVMFTGAADDQSVGKPGLYHWFEHVPFRGTTKFPGGSKETTGRFTRHSGNVNAYTSYDLTAFNASVPTRLWKDGLELITDLVAQPLLHDAAIHAERDVIRQEINGALSDIDYRTFIEMSRALWGEHAYAHTVLGEAEDLDSMDTQSLRSAYAQGYDRSRAALFVSGDIDSQELQDVAAECAQLLPANGLSARQQSISHGEVPAWEGGITSDYELPFSSSIVSMLFPYNPIGSTKDEHIWQFAHALISRGADSPLYETLREDRKLVYKTRAGSHRFVDGGYFGLFAETDRSNVEAAQEAMTDVLASDEVRSKERFELVQDSLRSMIEMQLVNPRQFVRMATTRLSKYGEVFSDDQYIDQILQVTHEEAIALLDTLTPELSRTFIFRGEKE